jgi:hypothetical protein
VNAWLTILLIFTATHRLTRLAIKDEVPIVKVPRDAIIRFLDPTPEQIVAEPGLKGHWNGRQTNTGLFVMAILVLIAGAAVTAALLADGSAGWAAAVVTVTVLAAVMLGIIGAGDSGSTLAYLLECPWCMSAWVGGAVVLVASQIIAVQAPFLVWIAASTVTGLVGNYEVRHDQKQELAEIEKRRALAAELREGRR